ncbi:MAG: TlpA family protein disulfide reductase [Bacteroidales bacterium]|nr:TlpA family protein disulfide reductase [Bacteroidales bacterium]
MLVPHAPGYAAFSYAYFFVEPGGVEFVMDGDVPRLSDPVGKNRIYVDYESLDSEFRAGEMKTLCKRQDELFSADNYFSKEYNDLVEQSGSKRRSKEERDSLWHEAILISQSGEDLTPEARELRNAFAEERALHAKFALEYLENAEASLPAFFILVENLEEATGAKDLVGDFKRIYDRSYASLFQGSKLHESFSDAILSAGMYEGAHYVDFTLPDENGAERSLSSIIEGKPAVLDLWASWCRSCRVSSKAMIPVYTKYHASGLEYVGVAREYKDGGKWRQALSDDAYPWYNLIALEKDHSIWSKYGIPSAAGSLFLIDAEGIVVKINPAPSEVEEFMDKCSRE